MVDRYYEGVVIDIDVLQNNETGHFESHWVNGTSVSFEDYCDAFERMGFLASKWVVNIWFNRLKENKEFPYIVLPVNGATKKSHWDNGARIIPGEKVSVFSALRKWVFGN